ncbi:MAG: hypothetical protein KKA73_14915 [Chloroflexi bacterium]|nr:hypothetical protein [Chloroflexota bacterium]
MKNRILLATEGWFWKATRVWGWLIHLVPTSIYLRLFPLFWWTRPATWWWELIHL